MSVNGWFNEAPKNITLDGRTYGKAPARLYRLSSNQRPFHQGTLDLRQRGYRKPSPLHRLSRRASTSRPRASVPRRYWLEGGWYGSPTRVRGLMSNTSPSKEKITKPKNIRVPIATLFDLLNMDVAVETLDFLVTALTTHSCTRF